MPKGSGGRGPGKEAQVVINPDYPPSNQARCRRVTTVLETLPNAAPNQAGCLASGTRRAAPAGGAIPAVTVLTRSLTSIWECVILR